MEYSRLMQLEMAMGSSTDDVIMEGLADGTINIIAKIASSIKKMVLEMQAFGKELIINIESGASSIRLNTQITMIKAALRSGERVEVKITDVAGLTKKFFKSIQELKKEVDKIGSRLRKLALVRNNPGDKIERYLKEKGELQDKIEKILDDVSKDWDRKITVTGEMALKEATDILQKQKMYITAYTAMAGDLEKLAVQFEKNTKIAEMDYDLRVYMNENLTMLNQVKVGATKLLRKTCFAISVCIV